MAKSKADKWTTPEGISLIDQWAEEGKTDVQIAEEIGITRSTLAEWKKKYPEIGDALECPEIKKQRRKRDYWTSDEGMGLIASMYRAGKTDEEVAQEIGISRSTLFEWRLSTPELSETVRMAKKQADYEVVNSLFKNATGYAYTEQIPVKLKSSKYDEHGRKTEEERVEIVTIQKWHEADVPAQIFWLKNRDPENWRDKREYEVKSDGAKVEFLTPDDARWGE